MNSSEFDVICLNQLITSHRTRPTKPALRLWGSRFHDEHSLFDCSFHVVVRAVQFVKVMTELEHTVDTSEYPLDEVYAFAVDLAKKAGQLLLDAANQRIQTSSTTATEHVEKENSVDIVTQTDNG